MLCVFIVFVFFSPFSVSCLNLSRFQLSVGMQSVFFSVWCDIKELIENSWKNLKNSPGKHWIFFEIVINHKPGKKVTKFGPKVGLDFVWKPGEIVLHKRSFTAVVQWLRITLVSQCSSHYSEVCCSCAN